MNLSHNRVELMFSWYHVTIVDIPVTIPNVERR